MIFAVSIGREVLIVLYSELSYHDILKNKRKYNSLSGLLMWNGDTYLEETAQVLVSLQNLVTALRLRYWPARTNFIHY